VGPGQHGSDSEGNILSKALIMGGTIDGPNFPESARRMAGTIPGAQLFLEQDAGHVLHYGTRSCSGAR
jgi:hypothetical protein